MDDSWMKDGLCRETGGEEHFPDKGESVEDAKKICNKCTVEEQCLAYALATGEKFGVWGGKSWQQRKRLLKLRAAA